MIIDVKAVETGGTVIDVETITGSSVSLGKSPYINETTQTWWVYNDATNKYFISVLLQPFGFFFP